MTTHFKQTIREETTVNPQGAIQERRCFFLWKQTWVLVIVLSMYRYLIMCIVLFHQSWRLSGEWFSNQANVPSAKEAKVILPLQKAQLQWRIKSTNQLLGLNATCLPTMYQFFASTSLKFLDKNKFTYRKTCTSCNLLFLDFTIWNASTSDILKHPFLQKFGIRTSSY